MIYNRYFKLQKWEGLSIVKLQQSDGSIGSGYQAHPPPYVQVDIYIKRVGLASLMSAIMYVALLVGLKSTYYFKLQTFLNKIRIEFVCPVTKHSKPNDNYHKPGKQLVCCLWGSLLFFVFVVVVVVILNFSAQLQSIRSRTTTTTSLASSEYVPMPDVLLAGQELEECWEEEPEQDKGEESWTRRSFCSETRRKKA